jgi:hypothetical protein
MNASSDLTSASAAQAASQAASQAVSPLDPLVVPLVLSDPEVLLALAEYPEGPARSEFMLTALKIGVLSLKAARGTLDSDVVRREGDRLMAQLGERLNTWRGKFEERVNGSLSHYFDPQQGMFVERVNRLTSADGELAGVVRRQVQEAEVSLTQLFNQFVGENSQLLQALDPTGENHLVVSLQRTLDAVVQGQNQAILEQFSLDNRASALSRFLGELTQRHGDLNQALSRNLQDVVAEFSLDKEDSALSRLVSRVDAAQRSVSAELSLDKEDSALSRMFRTMQKHQADVLEQNHRLQVTLEAAVQAMQARKEESAKSTRHGIEFEVDLGEHLRPQVIAAGDVLQDTGASTGLIPNCKVGDYVITAGPEKSAAGARIVVEAKERADYDLAKTLEEADVARRNRSAGVCVFVHSTKTAQPSIPTFARFGQDLVVQWNAEDSASDVWLKAALMVAGALSVKAAGTGGADAASFERIDRAIERIRRHVEGFEEIRTSANTTQNAAERILKRARIMQEGLENQVEELMGELLKLKDRELG